MFNTFSATNSPPAYSDPSSQTSTSSGRTKAQLQLKHDQQQKARKKRHQVSRACDMCRLHRIKCDSNPECSSCVNRGVKCTNAGSKPAYTLSSAMQHIDELEAKVKRLEAELVLYRQSGLQPSATAVGTSSPASTRTVRFQSDGIDMTLEPNTEYYGMSSGFYFITKISTFLNLNRSPPLMSVVIPQLSDCELSGEPGQRRDGEGSMMRLKDEYSRPQQDYFLGLYWQSYHVMVPIISQKEFREHYESLWPDPKTASLNQPRRASPLVDIMLALCAQYGSSSVMPVGGGGFRDINNSSKNSSVAGCGYFRRCQAALASSLEKPSIVSLQCYALTCYYLLNASYVNMAYNTLGLAIRLAHSMGLYREPDRELPFQQQQLHRRIWWALHFLDVRLSIELGRPLGIQENEVSCQLPSDAEEVASPSSSLQSSASNITWLSFNVWNIKLNNIGHRITKIMHSISASQPKQPQMMCKEASAVELSKHIGPLFEWRDSIPQALKSVRQNNGSPMSIDMTPIDVDYFQPVWLLRQRVSLEMLWNNTNVVLHRQFICFAPSTVHTPFADGHALTCLMHARANTALIHQLLTQTDILNGWYEAYYFQWAATLSIISFLLAYPFCPSSQHARKAIDTGLEVFDLFGTNYPAAAESAQTTRGFVSKIDALLDRIRRDPNAHTLHEQRRQTFRDHVGGDGLHMPAGDTHMRLDSSSVTAVTTSITVPPTPAAEHTLLPPQPSPVVTAATTAASMHMMATVAEMTGTAPPTPHDGVYDRPAAQQADMLQLWGMYENEMESILSVTQQQNQCGMTTGFQAGKVEPDMVAACQTWGQAHAVVAGQELTLTYGYAHGSGGGPTDW